MSPIIYLFRHGETVWNRERRMQGRRDSPLTVRGIEQARAYGRTLAAVLREPAGYRLVTSPLGRAWQTAVILGEALGRAPSEIVHDSLLMEMTWGDWDGLTAAEIEARDPELWQARIADRFTVAPPGGGETQLDVIDRAGRWLAGLPEGDRIIATAHGAFGRALRCAYLEEPAARMLEMDEPQDAFFRLEAGVVQRIDCEEV